MYLINQSALTLLSQPVESITVPEGLAIIKDPGTALLLKDHAPAEYASAIAVDPDGFVSHADELRVRAIVQYAKQLLATPGIDFKVLDESPVVQHDDTPEVTNVE
ncbi:MAG: hypothetical protein ABUL58_00235 [Steroidobacter sp.]